MDKNIIPPITDPLGKYWDQPDTSEIEIDNTHAMMNEHSLDGLLEYSSSIPSGVYVGKMWKRKENNGWVLCWFGFDKEPGYVSNNYRSILVV